MSDPSDFWRALTGPGITLQAAQVVVPKHPGLFYAIYGHASTWNQLGLGDPSNERPLYVGKSESNLQTET